MQRNRSKSPANSDAELRAQLETTRGTALGLYAILSCLPGVAEVDKHRVEKLVKALLSGSKGDVRVELHAFNTVENIMGFAEIQEMVSAAQSEPTPLPVPLPTPPVKVALPRPAARNGLHRMPRRTASRIKRLA